MTNVIVLPVVTSLDVPAERILQGALDDDLEHAIVIGRNQDGTIYFASSLADGAEVNWLLDHAKLALFQAAKVIPE